MFLTDEEKVLGAFVGRLVEGRDGVAAGAPTGWRLEVEAKVGADA